MIKLNFTPLWYAEIRRNKLAEFYKNMTIILDVILILSSLIFIVTFVNMTSLSNESKHISSKIGSFATSQIDKYNLKLIEILQIKLFENINYSEIIVENNTAFIDFKYIDQKSYTDNLKLLEEIKGFKIIFIGMPTEKENGTYYRVGIRRDGK